MSFITGAIGSAIGTTAAGTFGWTAATWAQIGWTAGVMLGNYLLAPDNPDIVQEGARLGDLRIQTSTYGKYIPKIFGKFRIGGNIIWATEINETKHEERDEGKGGGGGSYSNIWYTYDASLAVALCEGPIFGVRKIWFDSALVYDHTDSWGQTSSLFSYMKIHLGSGTEPVDWVLQSYEEDTPAYRHIAYVVFDHIQLENYGDRIPNITCEVHRSSIKSELVYVNTSMATGVASVLNADVSQHNIYIATNPKEAWSETYLNLTYHGDYVIETGKMLASEIAGGFWTPYGMHGHSKDGTSCMIVHKSSTNVYTVYQLNPVAKTTIAIGNLGHPGAVGYPGFYYIGDNGHTYVMNKYTLPIVLYNITFKINPNPNPFPNPGDPDDSIIVDVIDSINLPEDNYSSLAYYDSHIYVIRGYEIVSNENYGLSVTKYDENLVHIHTFNVEVGNYIQAPSPFGEFAVDNEGYHLINHSDYYYIKTDETLGGVYEIEWDPTDIVWPGYTNDSWSGTFLYKDGWLYNLKDLNFGGTDDAVLYQYNLNRDGLSEVEELNRYSTLETIITTLSLEVGLEPTDLNYSAGYSIDPVTFVTKEVTGYAITSPMSARSAIEVLLQTYNYAIFENDHKLELKKLDAEPAYVIDYNDLGATLGDTYEGNLIEINKKQEIDSIKKLTIVYANVGSDYEKGAQTAFRIDTSAKNEIIKELPLTLSDDEAKQLVEELLYRSWLGLTSYKLKLPLSYSFLKPTDVVTIDYKGISDNIRIVAITYNEEGLLEIDGVKQTNINFESTATGSDTSSNGGKVLLPVGDTEVIILDIPTVHNKVINDPGVYVGAYGLSETWKGCTIFSKTSEVDDLNAHTVLLGKTPYGVSTTVLERATPTIIDTFNEVTVTCHMTLYSVTKEELTNHALNYIVLGPEILQYADVVDNEDGTYTLSTFIRGRRGTEQEIGNHSIGEPFVLLSQDTMDFIPKVINNNSYYSAVTIGNHIWEYSEPKLVNNTGINMRPFYVEYIKYTGESGIDINLTWMRRSRYISSRFNNLPIIDIPEQYEIDIVYQREVINTYVSSTPSFIYTVALQVADNILTDANVIFDIYHISSSYGRGPKASVQVGGTLNAVVHWNLDELTGSTIVVDSVSGQDGTVINTPTFEEPSLLVNEAGTSILFNGTDNRIDSTASDIMSIGTTGELSISLFYKTGTDIVFNGLISKAMGYYEGDLGYEWYVYNKNNRIECSIINGDRIALKWSVSSEQLEINTKYHIAVNFFGVSYLDKDPEIYINGNLQDNYGMPASTEGIDTESTLALTRIGYYYNRSDTYLDGHLDDIKIFNKILYRYQVLSLLRS